MSTGPTAIKGKRFKGLAFEVRRMPVLVAAWHEIRRNSETSRSRQTRERARLFGGDLPRNLKRIQRRLAAGYVFSPARAATFDKEKGSRKRPLVIASLEDRIVQRAILDVLQEARELVGVQEVLHTPTSIGGIRGRGVDWALDIVDHEFDKGAKYIGGSDISGFFTKISRKKVVEFIEAQTEDLEFIDLFKRALDVELENASDLDPEELKLFPTGSDGVAQGCPLSAFAGNVVLNQFDKIMNDPNRGVVCIRYIDDFMMIAIRKEQILGAMRSAARYLATLGMNIYDPASRPDKAFVGGISEGCEFLGYRIIPGVFPPANKAGDRLLSRIATELGEGRAAIRRALENTPTANREQAYAQTIVAVDEVVRGWAGSFRRSRCSQTMERLDAQIDRRLSDFNHFYRRSVTHEPTRVQRRALGVRLLQDQA